MLFVHTPAWAEDKAVMTGQAFEEKIERLFTEKGFTSVLYSQWQKSLDAYGEELLLRHVPYTTLYGTKGYTEFVLHSKRHNLNTRIEAKWQQSSGSTDEKLPYLYLNSVYSMPENDVILVVDGPGWRVGAIAWLRTAAQNKALLPPESTKNITVTGFDALVEWASKTLTPELHHKKTGDP